MRARSPASLSSRPPPSISSPLPDPHVTAASCHVLRRASFRVVLFSCKSLESRQKMRADIRCGVLRTSGELCGLFFFFLSFSFVTREQLIEILIVQRHQRTRARLVVHALLSCTFRSSGHLSEGKKGQTKTKSIQCPHPQEHKPGGTPGAI